MILITGNKGFIGCNLIKKLDNVIGIDIKDGMNLLTCDLPDSFNLEYIYHLAAQSSVESSWHDPIHDLNNIRLTARLVHRYPDVKVIYANSCASMDMSSPYGFSKWASAEYIKKFHKNYVDCIFPNIYGNGSKSVVDIFKSSEEVTIYGDGSHTRDYVHIDDLVEGLIKAQDWSSGSYFMGSGKSLSVLELAQDKKIKFAPERKEAAMVEVPNTTPNWKAKINVLEYIK